MDFVFWSKAYPGVRGWIPYSFPIYTQVRVWRYDGVSIKSETLGTEYGRVRNDFDKPVRVRVRLSKSFKIMVRSQYGVWSDKKIVGTEMCTGME